MDDEKAKNLATEVFQGAIAEARKSLLRLYSNGIRGMSDSSGVPISNQTVPDRFKEMEKKFIDTIEEAKAVIAWAETKGGT